MYAVRRQTKIEKQNQLHSSIGALRLVFCLLHETAQFVRRRENNQDVRLSLARPIHRITACAWIQIKFYF